MVFSSLTFLYFFLPLTLIFYYISPRRRWRNAVLLLASLLFYSWGEPKYLLLMLAASAEAYAGGLALHHFQLIGDDKRRKAAFIITLVLLTANLFVFKYLGFTAESLGKLLGRRFALAEIALPIGISFYTFQIISYVIDLYRGEIAVQRNYLRLLLYMSFFPQLIAGPIVRYKTVAEEIVSRRESLEDAMAGSRRFIIGLAKKVLIANGAAELAELIYAGGAGFGTAFYWLAAVAYTLQIYFDFSGYSDMAIGLGRIFGFHFLENFNYPYAALSVTDFWRRWHISLSSWFRDYVYIPLGGNRVGRARWIFNILLVWALTGLWHGASWNFVLWGLYYGLILVLEKLALGKALARLPGLCRWLYTAIVVTVGWVIFDLTDFPQLLGALRMMFSFTPSDYLGVLTADAGTLYSFVYIPLGLIFMLPPPRRLVSLIERYESATVFCVLQCLFYFALLFLCVAFILSSSFNPFIYFRF